MAKKKSTEPDPAALLSNQIVTALEERRNSGGEYPCSLRAIGRAIQPAVTDSELQAAADMLFKSKSPKIVAAFANDLDSLVCLKEDKEKLATDERVLSKLLNAECSTAIPIVSVADLTSNLTKALQPIFKKHWESRLKQNQLPDFARVTQLSVVDAKGKKKKLSALHDIRFPLPWDDLSRQLVQSLLTWTKTLPTLAELVRATNAAIQDDVVQRAVATSPFSEVVSPVFADQPDGPLFHHDNAGQVAQSDDLIPRVLEKSLKDTERAIDIDKLLPAKSKSLHAQLVQPVKANLLSRIEQNRLPAGVGAVLIKKWHLFFLRDAKGIPDSTRSTTPSTQVLPAGNHQPDPSTKTAGHANGSFAPAFESAFARLDEQSGYRNFLTLAQLRQALPQFSRGEFDTGLAELRRARHFTLEGSEGSLTRLSEAERQAGITESGELHIYCRRIK